MYKKRKLPRFSTKKKVKVFIPQTEGLNRCVIEDIHLKGMCVSFKSKLPPQQFVKMSFSIGDLFEPICIEAQIIWEKENEGKYIYGLLYSKISDYDKDRIYKYLNAIHYDQFKSKWWA